MTIYEVRIWYRSINSKYEEEESTFYLDGDKCDAAAKMAWNLYIHNREKFKYFHLAELEQKICDDNYKEIYTDNFLKTIEMNDKREKEKEKGRV